VIGNAAALLRTTTLTYSISCERVFVFVTRKVCWVVAPCGWVTASGRVEGMFRKRFAEERLLNRNTGFDLLYSFSLKHFSF
jgi:hypothetical protein